MTNVKLEKSTILSIGGTVQYIFIQIFRAPPMYSFWAGGRGIRLVDNGVHEKHVAQWNSQFLQEQWTYLSTRRALFFAMLILIPVYETTHTSMPKARSPERHRSELEEVTHRAAKSLRFHSAKIKSSAGSIHSKPRWWLNHVEPTHLKHMNVKMGSSSPNTGEDFKTNQNIFETTTQ